MTTLSVLFVLYILTIFALAILAAFGRVSKWWSIGLTIPLLIGIFLVGFFIVLALRHPPKVNRDRAKSLFIPDDTMWRGGLRVDPKMYDFTSGFKDLYKFGQKRK